MKNFGFSAHRFLIFVVAGFLCAGWAFSQTYFALAQTPPASPSPAPSSAATAAPSPAGTASPAAASPAATAAASPAPAAMPPANFGSPPSGEIPILFNDRHVYANPDVLKSGRVLAALVRGSTILIPLRSMFEQMGATVSYDPASKTADVTKPGSDVKVTVGKPEVIINGETRPLDVPPEIYQGNILVPVRVISEGMGAYVQWVPDKRVVVVRYLPATPPPAPAPPSGATPAPTPPPTPAPVRRKNQAFIAGDYMIAGKIYNEFSAGYRTTGSWAGRAAAEFGPLMIGYDYTQYRYPHNCSNPAIPTSDCLVTVVGRNGQAVVPAFTARDTFNEVHVAYRILDPRIYVGVGWQFNTTNYGYPNQSGFTFGVEKLPDLDNVVSYYGSYYFTPNTRATYTGFGQSLPMQYSLQTYKVGVTWTFAKPVFFEIGYMGNRGNAKANSPSGYTHNFLYGGLGVYFNY